ncbi:hypothetical protein CEXT_473921 [Caerostris extrusa]|uniref:Uncharacterized protein n=1 Tax=Caerostris extrusa TaxID=172846 RepID=A0AAV4VF57_CAEEX|nr:hypothetical protein CEXT_473921 [Caerostris extrusa]
MDTLSEIAKELINEMADSRKFLNFLLKKVYGKPKPDVLPIVRSYWKDEDDFKLRLITLKSDLKKRHIEYMEGQHKKDKNLIRRIDRLEKNIEKEQREERRRTTHQTTITRYYAKVRN